jgi:hypothetical protein
MYAVVRRKVPEAVFRRILMGEAAFVGSRGELRVESKVGSYARD